MTRATMAGAVPALPRGSSKDEPDAKPTRVGGESDGDAVLVDQFTREFQALLRQTKEAQFPTSSSADATTRFNADGDAQVEKRSVAHFGVLGQRLLTLVRRLVVKTPDMAVATKTRLLLRFGDKFVGVHEFQAADRYFYSQIVALAAAGEPKETGTNNSERLTAKDEVYVQALFGQASCRFQLAKRSDPYVRFPGTLERLLGSLQLLQEGMQEAVELEHRTPHKHAWLLLNGSILVYSVARPLLTMGFEREIVPYLKWSLLCLESTVMLSTTKYILWRLQLYAAVCECLERLAMKRPKKAARHLQSALACAEHAAHAVRRLRKEEEMDTPLPKTVLATLRQAETIVDALVMRARAVAKGEPFGQKLIENSTRFTDVRDRLRLAVEALDKAAESTSQHAVTSELFDFALELAQPLIQAFLDRETEDDAASTQGQLLNGQLPITLHLILIRHACRLRKTHAGTSLVDAAKARARTAQNVAALTLELDFMSALLGFDVATSSAASEQQEDSLVSRQRALSAAEAARRLVCQVSGAVPMVVRDLLISTAMRLWKDTVVELVRELDGSLRPADLDLDPQLVQHTVQLVEDIYTVLRALDCDDMIVLGEICLRLALLLNIQENRRKAIRTLRDFVQLLNAYRDKTVGVPSHLSSMTAGGDSSLASASFSFDVNPASSQSDCYPHENSGGTFSRRSVGIQGTGSQLGSIHQELACIHVDILMTLFQTELEDAAIVDTIDMEMAPDHTAKLRASRRLSMVTLVENALQKEFKKNLFARVLLNTQLLRRSHESSSRTEELVTECFKLLSQGDTQERDLNKVIGLQHSDLGETPVPRAPRIISRCSSAVTIDVVPFKPSTAAARRRAIAYYMVFGKPSGAGTAVSLNNCELPGTGEPLYTPNRTMTISGLCPNTSYVFAVAAFDHDGEVIQSIGETSKPVVALNPLPIVACFGYLAQVCYQSKLMQPAQKAAMQVYDMIVSKELETRPGWSANYFYRHALKRDVIARWPIPLLDLAVQCILVLCDEEDGDPTRDGQLISDGLALRARQITILETSKKVAIGLEIACAAADFEQIRALCFKGYRILLPLLHLDDSNGLTFVALSTFYQAAWCIPSILWDTDTCSITARIAFELLRVAWRHDHVADATYSQVAKLKNFVNESPNSSSSIEMAIFLDSIVLAECSVGRVLADLPTVSRPNTAILSPQSTAVKPTGSATAAGAKAPAAPAVAPPQTTARAADEARLPRISELVAHSKLDVREAFKLLEPFLKTNRDALEVFCKICHCAIDAGEETAVQEWLPLVKITGKVGTICKETLSDVGLGHLLPEPAPVVSTAPSAPTTARSGGKTPRAPEPVAQNVLTESPASLSSVNASESEFGEDDSFVYTWCGELCLIEAIAEYRKLARYRIDHDEADCMRGPRYDYAFSLLNGGATTEAPLDMPAADSMNLSTTETGAAPAEVPKEVENGDTGLTLLKRFSSRMAASCRLFTHARAWQALQTAAQYAANATWLGWISPETLGREEHSSTLDNLIVCADSLLEMVEAVMAALKDEQSGKTPTMLATGSGSCVVSTTAHNHRLSLVSTTVAVSAMSTLNADQTWISNFLEFHIQALLAARRWQKVVQIGKKYHFLSGGGTRFSEKMAPLLVYAQQQHLTEQTARLESAQGELAAFVKAFHDAEAKKKKKKSRLVVEEVLTPEEIEFRAKKEEMDGRVRELAQEHSARQRELDTVRQIHDMVSRATNKCIQAFDNCHELVGKYRRFGAASVKPEQIIHSYSHCVALSRQKRQRRIAGKALQELGDFLWECGDAKAAVKSWNEAIDSAFNALRATTCWREIIGVTSEEQQGSGDPLVEGEGLWICLESCIAMAKLILFDASSDTSTLEIARMASATFTRVVTKSSLPHPSRQFLYGSYQLTSQIWPTRELLADVERIDAPRLALMFTVTIQTLLQYEHAVEAMPLIAGYEHLAAQCFEDVDHRANALRLRVDALVQCGRFHEAFQALAVMVTDIAVGRERKLKLPTTVAAKLQFHEDRSTKDPLNSEVLTWLATLDIPKLISDLVAQRCKLETARLIGLSVLKVVLGLSQREPIEEESASPLRQIGSKMATALTGLFAKALELHKVSQEQHVSDGGGSDPQGNTVSKWEALALQDAQAEVILCQAMISASSGQWVSSQELCTQAIQVAVSCRSTVKEQFNAPDRAVLSLDRILPPTLLHKPSTLVARARLLSCKMDMAQRKYAQVSKRIGVAVEEAHLHREQLYFTLQLELIGAEALAMLGSTAASERELLKLRDAYTLGHLCETKSYVELLRVLAFLQRSQTIGSQFAPSVLQRGLALLEEAEETLDRMLRRDGWIGTDPDTAADKRMSIFNPSVFEFVQLKAQIAQALMDTPTESATEKFSQIRRALLTIDTALKTASHSIKSLGPTKAKLLLQKGVILKRAIVETEDKVARNDLFDQCVTTLVASVEESIKMTGGHDRELVRLAFMELVDLHGEKFISGKEVEHLQAAFHYLNLALLVRSHQRTLFDTLELQAGSLVNVDKLPGFLAHDIFQTSGGLSTPPAEPPRATPPPQKGGLAQVTPDASKRLSVDAPRLVNYFLSILRTRNLLPPCTGLQEDTLVLLHTFLVQNHSTYAQTCCLESVPTVPREDPEIKGGTICAQWMRDLAPALVPASKSTPSMLSLYFTLGTVRFDGLADFLAQNEGARMRFEHFATSPLLSRRSGMSEADIRGIAQSLSKLRIDMEDEESLIGDRTAFPTRFRTILRQIQQTLRTSPTQALTAIEPTGTSQSPVSGSDSVLDTFNVDIPVKCSVETVRILEAMFQVNLGVSNAIDNELCYFLRDLLDS